jgi:hypothetical protein
MHLNENMRLGKILSVEKGNKISIVSELKGSKFISPARAF